NDQLRLEVRAAPEPRELERTDGLAQGEIVVDPEQAAAGVSRHDRVDLPEPACARARPIVHVARLEVAAPAEDVGRQQDQEDAGDEAHDPADVQGDPPHARVPSTCGRPRRPAKSSCAASRTSTRPASTIRPVGTGAPPRWIGSWPAESFSGEISAFLPSKPPKIARPLGSAER